MKRKLLLVAAVAPALACVGFPSCKKNDPVTSANKIEPMTAANELCLKGEYAAAERSYVSLVQAHPELADDLRHSIAFCAYKLGKFDSVVAQLQSIGNRTLDDSLLLIDVLLAAGKQREALSVADKVPEDDLAPDPELLAELATSATKLTDAKAAWRYVRILRDSDPDWMGSASLPSEASLELQFFGYGPASVKNYATGVRDGGWGSVKDTASTLWGMVTHPIKTAEDLINAVKAIFTKDNLELLLDPKKLAEVAKSTVATEVRAIWSAAKERTAKRHKLDADKYEHQQELHEIAAGYLVGYAGAEVAQILIPVGAAIKLGKRSADAVLGAEQIAYLATKLEELRIAKVWEESLEALKRFPSLRRIPFMTPEILAVFESTPFIAKRLPQIIKDVEAIKEVGGAERLVSYIKNGVKSGKLEKVEGHVFELSRAADYARRGKKVELQKQFKLLLAEPGKPVRLVRTIPDLVLDGDTLVEAKYRSGPLNLDKHLERQLRKYREAVKQGMYKRVRLEVSGSVGQSVRDRCAEIMKDIPFEIADNLQAVP